MEQQHASQDKEARQEIHNLYERLTALSELVKIQQNKILRLEEEVAESSDVEFDEEQQEKLEEIEDLRNQVEELTEQLDQEEEKTDSEDEESGKDIFFDSEGVTCPFCGETKESIRGLASHIGNKKDHKDVTEHFKVESGFYNPIQDEIYEDRGNFNNSWYELETSATQYFVENFHKLDSLIKDSKLDCPQCGESYDSMKAIQMHTVNKGDHKKSSEFFKVDGEYVNPVTGRSYKKYSSFRKTWDDLDDSITSYYYKNFGELPAQA
jgi:hypothetical protein